MGRKFEDLDLEKELKAHLGDVSRDDFGKAEAQVLNSKSFDYGPVVDQEQLFCECALMSYADVKYCLDQLESSGEESSLQKIFEDQDIQQRFLRLRRLLGERGFGGGCGSCEDRCELFFELYRAGN